MDAEKLREDLLHGDTPDLRRRRGIMGLSAVSLGLSTIGALRQTGVIPTLLALSIPEALQAVSVLRRGRNNSLAGDNP